MSISLSSDNIIVNIYKMICFPYFCRISSLRILIYLQRSDCASGYAFGLLCYGLIIAFVEINLGI